MLYYLKSWLASTVLALGPCGIYSVFILRASVAFRPKTASNLLMPGRGMRNGEAFIDIDVRRFYRAE